MVLVSGSLRERLKGRSELTRMIDSMGWLIFDKLLRLFISVLVGIWVARYLGPERFGELSFAIALVAVGASFAGMGLNGIVVRDLVRQPELASATMGSAFVLQSIAAVLALVGLAVISVGHRIEGASQGAIILILSGTLVFKVTDVAKYWLEATLQVKYGVWVENGALIVGAVLRTLAIVSLAGVVAFAWVGLLEAALAGLGLLVALRLLGPRASLHSATLSRARAMLKDAWPLLMAGMAVMLYMRVDMLMLRHLSGSAAVGVYAAATRISEVFYLVPTVIVTSVSPALIRSHAQDLSLYRDRMGKLYCLLAWLAMGCAVPVAILSGDLMTLVFGDQYASAGPVLLVHVFGGIAVFVGVASSQYLLIEGKQGLSLWRTLIGLVCNVCLNFAVIPRYGAVGAAAATVCSYFVATYSLLLFRSTRSHALAMLAAPFIVPARWLRHA